MSEVYAGRQFVGMDLHRRRSVLVRMSNDRDSLADVMSLPARARRWCWRQRTAGRRRQPPDAGKTGPEDDNDPPPEQTRKQHAPFRSPCPDQHAPNGAAVKAPTGATRSAPPEP